MLIKKNLTITNRQFTMDINNDFVILQTNIHWIYRNFFIKKSSDTTDGVSFFVTIIFINNGTGIFQLHVKKCI